MTTAFDGNKGLELARAEKYDVVVLDLMMPERDGVSILKALRKDPRTEELPVLILSARGQTEDRIAGLSLGANDYMTKPFSPKELVLRVKGLVRRNVSSESELLIAMGPFELDKVKSKFYLNGEPVELTQTEFSLLLNLCEQKGSVISRPDLFKAVWGYTEEVKSRTLDTHMKRLRQKLGEHSQAIETIRNVGYKIVIKS